MTDTTELREAAGAFIKAAARYLAEETAGFDRNLRHVTLNAPAFSHTHRTVTLNEGVLQAMGLLMELEQTMGWDPGRGPSPALDRIIKPEVRKLMAGMIEKSGGVEIFFCLAVDASGVACRILNAFVGDENSAPALAPVMLGVNETAPGEYEYTTLAGELSGGETVDGVEREYGAAEIVKAYVDNSKKFQGFVLAMKPPGEIELGAAVGKDAMVELLWQYYGNSCTWDEFGVLSGGEAWAKQITYTGLATGSGHVAFIPAQFALPAECRVN